MHRPHSSLPPQVRRHLLWLSLLVAASLIFSLGLACATPLAAFAAAVALTSSRRDALILILSAWFANQFVGFTVPGYPWAASAFAWGVALGASAVLATLAGQWTASRSVDAARVVRFLATAFAAFAAYEAALFVVAATLLGGTEDFTAAILGWIFVINAAAFVGVLVLHRLAVSVGLVADPAIPLRITEARA
jgi:hypothetical protein